MDRCTNRLGRSQQNKLEFQRTSDIPKTGRHKNTAKSRIIRITRRYHSLLLSERKLIFGFFTFGIAYIYLFHTAWLQPVGMPVSGQSKTNQRNELTPLRPIDYEQYTIRMNSWRRPKQLVQSVKHHASCPGVKEIQIVWCDKQNEPPRELLEIAERNSSSPSSGARVVIERHEVNSLNERFNIIMETPTLGVLSIDDDVLRPCEAIDSGFFKWAKSPHRMVGFDARIHVENDDGSWQYGYLSTTKDKNMYSLSLTRYCFIHRDYMYRYTRDLPGKILDTVATKFNCEDIAMSLMISSQTHGRPPLLADLWAIKSQLKLEVDTGISGSGTHKKFRDECLDSFASLLGLKDTNGGNRLQQAQWIHRSKFWGFECGAREDDDVNVSYAKSNREIELVRKLEEIRRSDDNKQLNKFLAKLVYEAGEEARINGLLNTKK